jgi:ribonuclease Z
MITPPNQRTPDMLRAIPGFLVALALAIPIDAATAQRTEVVLLGTGMPRPDPAAAAPATAIVRGDLVLLFDAGPGVMRQLRAANLPITGPTALFLTHLHSDHTLGYPDLVLTSWVMGRRHRFPDIGPVGIARMTDLLLEAWATDIKIRTEGLEREPPGGEQVTVREIEEEGVVWDSAGVTVTAFRVPHGDFPNSFGFRVETPDRVVVISGDTGPSEAVERMATGVDVLIHEVYSSSHLKPEERPGGDLWPAYMHSFHTSDEEIGRLAARARPGLVLLTHIILMGGSHDDLLAGVRRGGFAGRVVVGRDLVRY